MCAHRLLSSPLGLAALALLAAAGCLPANDALGTRGEEGRAYFNSADTVLVFSESVMVGSTFEVHVVPVDTDQDGALAAGTLSVDEPSMFSFIGDPTAGHATIRVEGPGESYLRVSNPEGEEVDRILLRAAVAVSVEGAAATMTGSAVDPRVPARFGTLEDSDLPLFIAGLDRCGGALLPVNVVDLETLDGGVLEVEKGGANDWTLHAGDEGEGELAVIVNEQPWVTYDVEVVRPRDIDDVEPWISAYDQSVAQIWARAWADDTEVVGLVYGWSASDRVSLRNLLGTYNVAGIESGADAGPALVELTFDGDTVAEMDLFAATALDLSTGRVPPPEVAEPTPTASSSGCGGSGSTACDPYAAFLVGAFALRRLRRLRARR
jgi:hypothetical protein